MEYLFLRRRRATVLSERQKALLFRAADRQWKEELSAKETEGRKVDYTIYKGIVYLLEIHRVFLDASLSLKKLSGMLETNQTYLSNVVNRYFGCNLKELLNTYRIEYAKELLRSGFRQLEHMPGKCGFASKSPFYVAFRKQTGMTPLRYVADLQKEGVNEPEVLL